MTTIATTSKTTVSVCNLPPQSPESAAENRLKAATEHAHRLTEMEGCQSAEAAIAWETVGELKTAQSHQRVSSAPSVSLCQSAFDRYCTDTPHAPECRIYDC